MEQIKLDFYTGVMIISVFLSAFIIARVIRWLINQAYKRESKLIKVDPTTYKFAKNAISFIIWLIAFAVIALMIPQLKALAVALFAGAGILFAIAGFAAQSAFSNIIAGIFIVIFKPFKVGDLIKVGDRDRGIVEDITLRHVVIVNFENKRIVIPNSIISDETVINDNLTDKKTCKYVEVGISYDSDLDKAIEIMQTVSIKHKHYLDNRTAQELIDKEPPVMVRIMKFDDFSVNLRAYVWTADPINAFQMSSDINKGIKEEFDKAGIEIPFPYRTIVYKKDLEDKKKKSPVKKPTKET